MHVPTESEYASGGILVEILVEISADIRGNV